MVDSNYMQQAREFWDFVFYGDPTHQHTKELVDYGMSSEELRKITFEVISTRGSYEEYYKEFDLIDWKNKGVLDFGCGAGVESLHAAEQGAIVTACDIVPSNVEITRRILSMYLSIGVTLWTYKDLESMGKFDIILSHGVLHHIPPPFVEEAVYYLKRRLKGNGIFFLMVYTRSYYPEIKLEQEGPYTRGYRCEEIETLFGSDMEVVAYQLVLSGSCAMVKIRRRE